MQGGRTWQLAIARCSLQVDVAACKVDVAACKVDVAACKWALQLASGRCRLPFSLFFVPSCSSSLLLAPPRPLPSRFGPLRSTLGPSGAHLGHLGPTLGPYFGLILPLLTPFGTLWGPCWHMVKKCPNCDRFGDLFWGILEAFLAPFLEHFSDIVVRGLLARIWLHFGTVFGPSGTQKTSIFIER